MFGCKNSDTGKVQVTGKAKRRPRELCNHKGNNCTLNELCDFNQNKKKSRTFLFPILSAKRETNKNMIFKVLGNQNICAALLLTLELSSRNLSELKSTV